MKNLLVIAAELSHEKPDVTFCCFKDSSSGDINCGDAPPKNCRKAIRSSFVSVSFHCEHIIGWSSPTLRSKKITNHKTISIQPLNVVEHHRFKVSVQWKGNTSTSLQPAMDMRLRIYQCWWWLLASMRSLFSFSHSVTVWWEGRVGWPVLGGFIQNQIIFFWEELVDLEVFFWISNVYVKNPQVCLFFNGASWLLTVKFRPRFSVFTGQKSQLQQPMLRFPAYLTTIIASSIHISLAVLAWFPPHGWLRFGNLALFAGHEMRAWSVTKQLENRLMKAHQCCFWKHLFDWYCGFSFINVVLWLLTFLHDHWVQCSALPIFAYAGVLFFFWKAYTYLGSGSFLPKGCKGSSLYCNSFWGAE